MGPSMRRSSTLVSSFFDMTTSAANSRTNTLRSCSSSDMGDGSDRDGGGGCGDLDSAFVEDGLMAEIGCCSPNWDPFASLSSSQSSDAESGSHDSGGGGGGGGGGLVPARNNIMTMSCSPILSTDANGKNGGQTVSP